MLKNDKKHIKDQLEKSYKDSILKLNIEVNNLKQKIILLNSQKEAFIEENILLQKTIKNKELLIKDSTNKTDFGKSKIKKLQEKVILQ